MKGILTSDPILNITDTNKYFGACIDVCKEELGGILSQKDHVVCYDSKILKEHERNCATHDLELVVFVHALKLWRNYLVGNKF